MKPIGVGIVGAGLSARIFHAPFLVSEEKSNRNYRLLSFLRSSSTAAVEGFENIPVANSMEEFVSTEGMDLVVITTPSNTHFNIAKYFLEAGKNVVVEKPFCVTSEEAEELIALAQQRNLILTVYHNRRWDGDFLSVKRVISQGVLGLSKFNRIMIGSDQNKKFCNIPTALHV